MTIINPRTLSIMGVVAACVIAQGVWAAEYNFNLANEYAANSLPGQNETFFIDLVKQNSNGKIDITPHFGGALGYKSINHYAAVRDGAVELASTPLGTMAGISPIFGLQPLPFLSPTIPENEALWYVARPYYEEALAKGNQTLLFGTPWTPNCIWATSKITKIDDLKGLKVRSFDIASTKAMQAAGMLPIQLSWADVIPALSTGTVAGVLTSDEGGVNSKLWDVGARYCNSIGYGFGIGVVTMNLDAYNKLPPDLQAVLHDAAGEAEKRGWQASRGRVRPQQEGHGGVRRRVRCRAEAGHRLPDRSQRAPDQGMGRGNGSGRRQDSR